MEKLILEKLTGILPNGYEILISEELSTKFIFFEKKDSLKTFRIGCLFNDDSVFITNNISASCTFKTIEYILNPKSKMDATLNYYGHQKVFNIPTDESIFSQLPIEYKTEADIDRGCELISRYINEIALPFFNYWQDIRDFLPFLETEDIGYLADFFGGHPFYRKVIIWKLCSHPKYKALTDNMLVIFDSELKESPNDKLLKKDYEKYLALLNRLEKTQPLYEWDEKYLIKKEFVV